MYIYTHSLHIPRLYLCTYTYNESQYYILFAPYKIFLLVFELGGLVVILGEYEVELLDKLDTLI